MTKLLTRTEFRTRAQERDRHRCVWCGASGIPLDAHHIIERRLFPDGGYYLENGATLCDPACHTLAEQTLISCDQIRERCGITKVVLPPHLETSETYDKWGNVILADGSRSPGELFWDENVQKILQPVLHLFKTRVKHPRTYHLPWSPGATSDDKFIEDTEAFHGKRVVVLVKMDGENDSIYGDDGYVHARSVEPISTPDCGRIKSLAAEIGPDIPKGWRLCGENLIRKHSIHYKNLTPHPRWFYQIFNIWKNDECLPWDEVVEWASLLDVPTVPILYEGIYDEKILKSLYQETHEGDTMEGYVVRLRDGFKMRDYRKAVGKYVRPNHVQTTHHWRREIPVFNEQRKS